MMLQGTFEIWINYRNNKTIEINIWLTLILITSIYTDRLFFVLF